MNSKVSPGRRKHSNARLGGNAEGAAEDEQSPLVPYGGLLGVTTLAGCPAYSNGDENFFSQEASEAAEMRLQFSYNFKCAAHKAGFASAEEWTRQISVLGVKWQCVEFARRFLLMSKAVWLRSVPVAESIWGLQHVTSLVDGAQISLTKFSNGKSMALPAEGDLIIWGRARNVPFGHVAVVTHVSVNHRTSASSDPDGAPVVDGYVEVAEQNHGFHSWDGRGYSRQLPFVSLRDGAVEIRDEDAVLGWLRVPVPNCDYSQHDIPDNFRTAHTLGAVQRLAATRDPTLAWLDPHATPTDFFLRRSLLLDGNAGEGGLAADKDTPDGYYVIDGDMLSHLRRAAHSLHDVALAATWRVATDANSSTILSHYFGVPQELHDLLRHTLRTVPAMFGRFDFGYDGERMKMLEYNCDSSAALYECMDTQEKWAQHKGGEHAIGVSSGSFLRAKVVEYFKSLWENPAVCPPHKLIHFMVDDDDEERYTALCAAQAAKDVGFRFKVCVKLSDFRYAPAAGSTAEGHAADTPASHVPASTGYRRQYLESFHIVDLEGERVHCVWKTWSWDTVLHQYVVQRSDRSGSDPLTPPAKPTLSDILLNPSIYTFEPFWKTVTGSKALLPYLYELAPDHPALVYCAFLRDDRMLQKPFLSKPVNGRAGQNITMYDAISDDAQRISIAAADMAQHADRFKLAGSQMKKQEPAEPEESGVSTPRTPPSQPPSFSGQDESSNETSNGRFFDSLVVFQRRVALHKFHQYYPIFCAWVVGDQFGGVVVREDTSKITKLGSIVAPCRVVR